MAYTRRWDAESLAKGGPRASVDVQMAFALLFVRSDSKTELAARHGSPASCGCPLCLQQRKRSCCSSRGTVSRFSTRSAVGVLLWLGGHGKNKDLRGLTMGAGLREKVVSTADRPAAAQLSSHPHHAESRLGASCSRYFVMITHFTPCSPSQAVIEYMTCIPTDEGVRPSKGRCCCAGSCS